KERSELLDSDLVGINCVLSPRSDLTNNGSGVSNLRRMLRRFFEYFQMPVVEIDAGTIGRLRWAAVSHPEIARDLNDLLFHRVKLLSFGLGQILPALAGYGGIKLTQALEESGAVEILKLQTGDISGRTVLKRVSLDAVRGACAASWFVQTIPSSQI